jgi:hypothetical protein
MKLLFLPWRVAALALAVPVTLAAAAEAPRRPDPLDARAEVPRLVYRSSLAGYRRNAEPEPLAWREANERARRAGGWRAYGREAQEPDAAASAPPAGGKP